MDEINIMLAHVASDKLGISTEVAESEFNKANTQLVGKWESTSGTSTYNFDSSGGFVCTYPGNVITGKYRIAKNAFFTFMTSPAMTIGPWWRFSVSGNSLTMTNEDGTTTFRKK